MEARMSKSENGEPFDIAGMPVEAADDDTAEGDSTKPDLPVHIDLAAWGRGERNYIFREVAHAIDDLVMGEILQIANARLAGTESPRGALDFLISEGIIDADEARQDL
jgi:hypothetical protein